MIGASAPAPRGASSAGLEGLDERAEELLGALRIEEKLAQLGCVRAEALMTGDRFDAAKAASAIPFGIGHVARLGGATQLSPRERATVANDIQRFLREHTRVGIPTVIHEEASGGYSASEATVFPQALGQAATWNPELVEELATTVREQMLAVGARHALAPVLDVARDPRWGRVEESYGEDPTLVAAIGTAFVRGLQGEDLATGVAATGKHFLGYAMSEGGRNWAPVHLGPRELREVYARPFAAAITEAGLASVMNSYGSLDGLPCASARSLLTGLLREELGFDGIVIADYFAVDLLRRHHHVASTKGEAARLALHAGLDIELPGTDCFGEPLAAELAEGTTELAWVDEAVRRVLRYKLRLGILEDPFVDELGAQAVYETPSQRRLARQVATESVVLLANDGVLPLPEGLRRIAVVGPGADDIRLLQGDYHYPAHQESLYLAEALEGATADAEPEDAEDETPQQSEDPSGADELVPEGASRWRAPARYTEHVSVLAGIEALAGPSCAVVHAPGCSVAGEGDEDETLLEAVELARGADVAVVVVAGRSGLQQSSTVGEARDATDLELTGHQAALVEAVAATGTPVVVVVLSGRVHTLGRVASLAGALVQLFPPGEEGGSALADVLFGRSDPSGRLPVTLPLRVGQIPRYASHRAGGSRSSWFGAYTDAPSAPLFCFGHGLSYTSFSYTDLSVVARSTSDPILVEVTVENTGERAGAEVVQCYASDLQACVARPEQQLVAFAKIELAPGASTRVALRVEPELLAYLDEELHRILEPGALRFAVGSSSANLRLEQTVELGGGVASFGR